MNHSGNAAKRGRRTAQMKLPPGGAQHAWKCSQRHVEVLSGRTQFFNNFPQVRPSESAFQIKLSERKRATQSDRADVALSAVASCYETRGVESTIQLSGDFTVKTDTKSRNPHLSIPFISHVIIIILRAYYKRWWWCVCECGWSIQSFPPAGGNGGRSGGAVMSDVISIFLSISNACAKTRHYCCNSAPSTTFPDISRHIGE